MDGLLLLLKEAFGPRMRLELLIAAALVAIGCLVRRERPRIGVVVIEAFQRLAARPVLSLFVAGLVPLLLRFAWLPWRPVPDLIGHDEYCHLLVAETLLGGRLANPAHAFWQYFEAPYVLQQPAYASSYPIGIGAILAVGMLLTGHAWAGVLLSIGLMSAAICWMLRAWLTPAWSLLGGLLSGITYGVATYWVDSYCGGGLAAAAGAVLFGALARWKDEPRFGYLALAIAGGSVSALIRPFETACVSPAVAVFLLWNARVRLPRLILQVAILSMPFVALTALHNYRVTGSPLKLPYQHSQERYGVPPPMTIQEPVTAPGRRQDNVKRVQEWQIKGDQKLRGSRTFFVLWAFRKAYMVTGFFLDYYFLVPFLLFPAARLRHIGLVAGSLLCVSGGNLIYPGLSAHYLAPITALFILAALSGLRRIMQWRFGVPIVAVLLVCASMRTIRPYMRDQFHPPLQWAYLHRSLAEEALKTVPGSHLVFVRYQERHNFHFDYGYNAAAIDSSPIVWAQEIEPQRDAELIRYFRGRHVWVLEVAEGVLRLRHYFPGKTASLGVPPIQRSIKPRLY